MAKKIFLSVLTTLILLVCGAYQVHADTTNYVKEAENSKYVLSVNTKTLAIQVFNKQSGYTWNSSYPNIENQGLNGSWQQFAESAITIDYINSFNKQRTTNVAEGGSVMLMKLANGFKATIRFRMAGIQIGLLVNLTENGIEVQVPQDLINESAAGRLVDMSIYPFLGATKLDQTKGYMLIPDGSGAEISYQDPTQMLDAYQQPYYGSDYGIVSPDQNSQVNNYQLTIPAYGIVNGSDALLSYVKSGAEYGQLDAQKAGLNTDFNWITSKFTYRSQYIQPTSQQGTGTGVQMYQQNENPVNIDIKYEMVSGSQANYTGLAQCLQKDLVSEGILHQQHGSSPIANLDFLGGDLKPGLFWSSFASFTPINFISQNLKKDKLTNVSPNLYSFGSNGSINSQPNPFPVANQIGSVSDFKKLANQNHNTMLDLAYWAETNPTGIKDTSYLEQISGANVQALQPKSYPELVNRDLSKIQALGIKSVNISGLGQNLDSDYSKNPTNRTQAMAEQVKAFEQLKKSGLLISSPYSNLYCWKYLTSLTQVPTGDSNYIYETQAVPFVQNLLQGYLTTYSDDENKASDLKVYKLKNILMGSFPSYSLTAVPTSDLQKTPVANDYYNTQYANWKDTIKSDLKDYSKIEKLTRGARVLSQVELSTDVYLTIYSNGSEVLVNLSDMNYRNQNTFVNKMSYQIVKGE